MTLDESIQDLTDMRDETGGCEYTCESGIAGTDGLVGDDGYVECGQPAVGVVMEPGYYGKMYPTALCDEHMPRESAADY